MKIGLFAAAAAAVALVAAAPASAAVFVTYVQGGTVTSLPGYTVIDNFNSGVSSTLTSGVAGTDYVIQSVNNSAGANIPTSSGNGTDYLSVLGGGAVTLTFAAPIKAFAFDWGSLDIYNHLTISGVGFSAFTVSPGASPIGNTLANGGQSGVNTNGMLVVTGNAGEKFKSITLASGTNSMEVDNLAVAVPEPATWALMIGGFGMAGGMLRRRRAAALTA